MADQTSERKAGQKADPALAQYTVNLTPEQYEEHLRASREAETPRLQMEMGGSGTAAAVFKDAAGADVAVTSTEWSATGPVTVTPDEANPASATLAPTGLGSVTITAVGRTDDGGSAQAHADLMVIEKIGGPVSGEITLTVAPPGPPPDPPVTRAD